MNSRLEDAQDMYTQIVEVLRERRNHPYGPEASAETQKVAGNACISLCGGDRDKARTLWRLLVKDLGYMPDVVCHVLYKASNTSNLVPDVEAPPS